jgi:hypothetical protein
MAKTVFDSAELKRKNRQQELEAQLNAIKEEEITDMVDDLPAEAELVEIPSSSESDQPDVLQDTSADTPEQPHRHKHKRGPHDYSQVLRDANGSGGALAAFVAEPRNMKFENQHENEKVLLVLRQHPVLNLIWITIALLMGLAPLVVFPILPFATVFPGIFSFFALILWYLLVTAYVIESFLHWYFNLYIITDERIIDVDFYSLIYKEVSEAKLDKVEDVTATTAGFLGAVFNYGTIAVQTAAERRQFEFAAGPYPARVTKFLNELILEEERERVEGRVM